MAATAENLNEQTTGRRMQAVAGQPGMNPHERAKKRKESVVTFIREKIDEVKEIDVRAAEIDVQMEELRAAKKACNSQRKAIYDALDDEGVSHVEFMAVYAELSLDDGVRAHRAASRAVCYEAANLKPGETLDFIAILEANEQAVEDAQRTAMGAGGSSDAEHDAAMQKIRDAWREEDEANAQADKGKGKGKGKDEAPTH